MSLRKFVPWIVGLIVLAVVVLVGIRLNSAMFAGNDDATPAPEVTAPLSNQSQEPALIMRASPTVEAIEPTPNNRKEERAIEERVRQLTLTGEKLYQEAAGIVANTPTTSSEGAELVGSGAAGKFYSEDRDFQSAIGNVPQIQGNVGLASAYLAEVETFLYTSVVASVASCNQHDAELNLKVARAFLDEVHRDLKGTPVADWTAPDISNEENNNSECQNE